MSLSMDPIPLQSCLAPAPTRSPKYSKVVKTSNGEAVEVADPRATRALVALMDMAAVQGGAASHWGGPAAFAELMSATHGLMFFEAQKRNQKWTETFHFVNDAGHCENGLYALKAICGQADVTLEKLKGFRSIESHLTGHGESHLFPQGVLLSNGPLGSSLGQAQGLAMADSFAGKQRMTITAISDGACMEGEAKEALAAIPGLAAKKKLAPFVLIISDNNTKLTDRIDSHSFSMQNSFAGLSDLGWKVFNLEQGNDLQSCFQTLEEAQHWAEKNPTQPAVVVAKTVKGFGVKSTEASSSGGHGFPLKKAEELSGFLAEIYGNDEVPTEFTAWMEELILNENKKSSPSGGAVSKQKVQVGVAQALIRKRKEGLPLISLSSDLPGSTGVAAFQKEFPESSQDLGIAESNMVSAGAGLSKLGFIPVVDTFTQFGVTKGALPLTMASLSQAPVIAIFSHAGFQDAADGASHQALTYFSKVSSIPHVDVYCLATSDEADSLVGQAVDEFYRLRSLGEVPNSSVFFLGRENFVPSVMPEASSYQLGKAQVVLDTTKEHQQSVTIVASGPMLHQALKAAEQLKGSGQGAIVVNPSIINRPDVETIKECLLRSNGRLITVEDHQIKGGMGSLLVHELSLKGIDFQLQSLGVHEKFGRSAYLADELYAAHGIDSFGILQAAQRLIH